jgi:hypothetical protein
MEPAMSNDSSGNPDELSSGGSRYHQVYPTLDERQLARVGSIRYVGLKNSERLH